jgi:hypothetical protein
LRHPSTTRRAEHQGFAHGRWGLLRIPQQGSAAEKSAAHQLDAISQLIATSADLDSWEQFAFEILRHLGVRTSEARGFARAISILA